MYTHTPTIILKPKRIYQSGRVDWCEIQSCNILTEQEGSCQAVEGFPTVREEKTNGVPVKKFLAWACGFDVQCTVPRACQVLPV